ncbi:crotonase/enoyl-CoA hydratase family protein [Nocardia fluminea]|uniref:Probable enoyl-CoA hydratase EchA17 n=1 Tax=Nocardia fluminea TaxID=134984 RepID=A0A2N3VK55_9NOCA|nr:crotonase/enoyl-CoA hydratase family protein [Nocardia fluminea]PKV81988.1 short chain enoyl-CoA hydratase [Nocardia fluminea]
MTEELALIEKIGNVALITMNRPQAKNAINAEFAAAVGAAFAQAEADPEVRVTVLTGAGTAFSAGADLKAVAAGEPLLPKEYHESGFGGFLRLGLLTKPVIAAVNGFALGGGTEIALACDLVVISEAATLGLPEVKRGLVAAGGGLLRLPQQIPTKLAMEVALTGLPIDPATALSWGLVNRVAPADKVVEVALELAAAIAENAPLAVQISKRVINRGLDLDSEAHAELWKYNDTLAYGNLESEDAREGAMAFVQKRPPVWKGQ